MADQFKNMIIGFFVIAALGILIAMILFITPRIGDQKQTLYVRFADINNINVGTRVLFAGKPVGEVYKIQSIPDAREQAEDGSDIYFYQLILHVDSSVRVFNTDDVMIETSGLLGEKSIAIVPKIPPEGVIPKRITNQPIYAVSEEPFQKAVKDLSEVATTFQGTLIQVSNWIEENQGNVAMAVKNFGEAMHSVDVTLEDLHQADLVGQLKTTFEGLSIFICQCQDAMRVLDQKDTFHHLGDMMAHLNRTSHSLESISQQLEEGKGTLGRLLYSDDLYLRLTAITSKIDTLMNDVNHYGILFNLDKKWQRTRTKRMNLLEDLRSPACFKRFVDQELDHINTSMARLTCAVEKAKESPEDMFQNREFQRDFKELMIEVNALAETLKLYNEQILKVCP